MTYVSVTEGQYSIEAAIGALMDKQLRPLAARIQKPEVAHAALEDIFGKDRVTYAENLPPGVVQHHSAVHFRMPNGATWPFNMSPAQPLLHEWQGDFGPYVAYPRSHRNIDEQSTPSAWALIKDDWELFERITKEKADLLKAIKDFLGKAKSLNQAVQVMPSLIEYLDPKIRERLFDKGTKKDRTPRPPRGKKGADVVISPEAISTLTKARMLNDV